ncbi:hypothetical protein ACFL3D_03380 [Candidatus Omnitrophota bacterium]
MPIHLNDCDIMSEVEGLSSAVIVACNMCAGASMAMRERKPFLQLFRSFLTSPPLERHIRGLQSRLKEKGVTTQWFRGGLVQQFFLCLWTSRQRTKLRNYAKEYDAVIVLGCDSAIETVRNSLNGTDCKIIQGTEVGGIMNTQPKFHVPCNIVFEESATVSVCDRHCKEK